MALLKRKRSGLSDPMSVVTKFVNACNRHDADSVAACLHPEFDSIQPMFPSRNFRGADQVRRNWQAIFDAEPGFRLTVLRQAAADDTVWLELHGAGREAEVAGVFVMGTQGDRIRWARIYSALIEPLPEGFADPAASSPATLRQVPPLREAGDPDGAVAAGADGAVEEDPLAPVLDIDGGGRTRRRRSSRRRPHDAEPAAGEPVGEDIGELPAEDVVAEDVVAPAAAEPAAAEPAASDWAPAAGAVEPVEPAPDAVVATQLLDAEPAVVAEPVEPSPAGDPAGPATAGVPVGEAPVADPVPTRGEIGPDDIVLGRAQRRGAGG